MPFLVLPASQELSDRQLSLLSSRMCPYSEVPRRVLRTSHHVVWATGLAVPRDGGVRNAMASGTADFDLRVSNDALVIRTDPLGTCPIWYARSGDSWTVSPEAKAIAAMQPVELAPDEELLAQGPRAADWSPFRNVSRLAPGCELRLSGDGTALSAGEPIRFELGGAAGEPKEDWTSLLGGALVTAFTSSSASTGAFISGGIDSAIACSLARRKESVATFSLGTARGDEFSTAKSLAQELCCSFEEIQMDTTAIREEFDRVVFQNELFDGLTAEILCQLSVLYGAAQNSCRRIVTGYGSDLLFDGMLRHSAYMAAVQLKSTPELIERTRWTGELAPFVHWSRKIGVEHVFWKPEVIELALRVPRDQCFADGIEKHVLRSSAVRCGLLPRRLAFREKIGMTNGTEANYLLSDALGIDDEYGYREKSMRCLEQLKRLF